MGTDNIRLNPGEEDEVLVAVEDVVASGDNDAKLQLFKLVGSAGLEGARTIATAPLELMIGVSARQDTYSTTAAGVTVDVSAFGRKFFSLQVWSTGGGTPTWEVVLEISSDGSHWAPLLTHTDDDGDGSHISEPNAVSVLYFRSRCHALSLGGATSITAAITAKN
jgi:hypothetical protein